MKNHLMSALNSASAFYLLSFCLSFRCLCFLYKLILLLSVVSELLENECNLYFLLLWQLGTGAVSSPLIPCVIWNEMDL